MKDILETCLIVDAENAGVKASKLLAEHTQLSQACIKDAMQKGAVWLVDGTAKKRLRRAGKTLKPGDKLELNYNARLLQGKVPEPGLIHDAGDYSIWFKPYGLYCQGSRWGDFQTIYRWVENHMPALTNSEQRPVFLVHRLDRATSGLMLLCHSKKAAQLFSALFQQGKIEKHYQAIVHGAFPESPRDQEVESLVDGKQARSVFSLSFTQADCSRVDIKLLTGRKHQIRIQLSEMGFPIVGDRLYGKDGDTGRDLQLQSVSLVFVCPFTEQQLCFDVSEAHRLCL